MGQKFSIDIQLEHGKDGNIPIVAGTSLRGKVALIVKRKLEPANLVLELIGKETTCVTRTGKSSFREERVIARASTNLRDSRGQGIRKGHYIVPFDFALPSSLPSTVIFPKAGRRNFNGRILYYLRVGLGNYKLDREFEVESAPLPSDIVPCIAQPTTHELKSFGMLNKGFLSVGSSVENSRVGRGHALRVSVASRNDTSVDLNRVRVKLVELIEYKAQGEKETLKVELEKLKDIDLPGLDKSRASRDSVRKNIKEGFEKNVAATYRGIYDDLTAGGNQFEVVIPKSARDSYDGNLISISHYLKVTFFTKALVENPSIKIPIVIGNARESEDGSRHRQPNEPIATVIFEDDIPDTESTIEVGSRAEAAPMAKAMLLGHEGYGDPEQRPSGRGDTIFLTSDRVHLHDEEDNSIVPAIPVPTAPSESSILANELENDDETVQSEGAFFSPPPRSQQLGLGAGFRSPPTPVGYSAYAPFQMYNNTPPGLRDRLPSYSYDTESGITTLSDSPQRLGGAPQTPQSRRPDSEWLLERLLQELNGSIHDYEVVSQKTREPGYKELFSTLSPIEFRSIIGHVTMSHQVQVALLLAKQLVNYSAFTCDHCAAALQRTSDYFRSNMVETLLPYCNDLESRHKTILNELSEWERTITARAFRDALE